MNVLSKGLLYGLLIQVMLSSCSNDAPESTTPESQDNSSNVQIAQGLAENEVELVADKNASQGTVINLDASKIYKLNKVYSVENGVTLNIPAGTRIDIDSSKEIVYIVVQKGGKINIKGEASNPVVIASQDERAGDWGGIVVCGDATTDAGVDAKAEVGGYLYGGTNDQDSSGSIEYLVLKGTGAQISTDSQFNGLSLYAVGSGTVVRNIAVINGADDGIEFFGGTVNAENVYIQNTQDDAIDWTEGWNGTLTNTYVKHTKLFSTAIEADGNNGNPSIVNFTAVSTIEGTALQFKKQSGATISNLNLDGYAVNIEFADYNQQGNVNKQNQPAPVANVVIDNANSSFTAFYNEGTKVDYKDFGLNLE